MGEIVTFYSYKGGTGRSMALANVAWILASRRKRVLMIDWDLEAPGLHRYFAPFLVDRDLTGTRGVIDFIREFAIRAATPDPEGAAPKGDWYEPLADIVDYAVSIRWPYFAPGLLDFIPAGQQDASYATRVNSFNWDVFYDRLGGGHFLDLTKKIIRDQYDYILIDSRTGVSDTSGICTVQMPDTVVVCFTLNNQSIKGAYSVAKSIAEQRTDGGGKLRVRILPVATRVDTFEKLKLDRRRAYAKDTFDEFLAFLPPSYWNDVEVPYWSFYAYEEALATFGDEPGAPNSMLRAFESICDHLTNGDVKELVPPPSEERQDILARFAEIPDRADERQSPAAVTSIAGRSQKASAAHDLYLSFHHLDEADAGAFVALLEGRRLSGIADSRSAALSDDWAGDMRRLLESSRAFAFCDGPYGLSSWQKRELALAFEHQRKLAAQGTHFPIVPIVLPKSNYSGERLWLYAKALDLRRRLDNPQELDALCRALLADDLSSFQPHANPYKGARSYAGRDAPLFFGRDKEIAELADLAGKSKVLFVTGASGSGKTSLINAGLLPFLRTQSPPGVVWEAAGFRPGQSPLSSLVRQLVPLWSRETNETSRALEISTLTAGLTNGSLPLQSVLALALERPPRPNRLLIAVDHAEDVFRSSPRPNQWERFFTVLHNAAEATPTTILLTIRPEWEATMGDVMPQWKWILRSAFRIRPMTHEQLAEVIRRPSLAAGRSEPPLSAEKLIESLESEPGALALISRRLSAAWGPRAEPAETEIQLDSYLGDLAESQRNQVLSAVARLVST